MRVRIWRSTHSSSAPSLTEVAAAARSTEAATPRSTAAGTMAKEEECLVCTEPLGLPGGAPAVHLPCGHIFCADCNEQWLANGHKDCPSCRQPFKKSKVRTLQPWQGGLRLKDTSSAEQNALKNLEEARVARAAMERRAATAERALHQLQAELKARAAAAASAAAEAVPSSLVTAREATETVTGTSALPPPPPSLLPQPVLATAREAVDAVPGTCAMPPPPPPAPLPQQQQQQREPTPSTAAACTLTEAQRQRAEANRLAAIERKRAREEAMAQRTIGEPQPT